MQIPVRDPGLGGTRILLAGTHPKLRYVHPELLGQSLRRGWVALSPGRFDLRELPLVEARALGQPLLGQATAQPPSPEAGKPKPASLYRDGTIPSVAPMYRSEQTRAGATFAD